MKILPFNPKSLFTSSTLDDSPLGLHALSVSLSELGKVPHGIVILGFADDTGIKNVKGRAGAASGPETMRSRLYKFTTGKPKVPLYDLGDLLPETTLSATHAAATKMVRAIREAGHFPIVIGGGHDFGFSHALGVLEESRKKTRIFNIDAHLDVRPVMEGVITSGSPWFLLREHSLFQETKSTVEEFGVQPHCNAPVLVAYAKKQKFRLHWLSEIRKGKKPAEVTFARLLGAQKGQERYLVSLDIDSVQIADAPGCSAPQTLGFSAREVIQMSFLSGAHPRVDSFGVFELSPPLDPDGRTALLVAHCINACVEGFSTRRITR